MKFTNFGVVFGLELKEHFQKILRDAEEDPKLTITSAEETEGTKIGDNYMSVVLKTKVAGKRGNGDREYQYCFLYRGGPGKVKCF